MVVAVTVKKDSRVHGLLVHLREDEHRMKLGNHLAMLLISLVLTGLVTGWEIRDMLIYSSVSGPTLLMEALDYLAKL